MAPFAHEPHECAPLTYLALFNLVSVPGRLMTRVFHFFLLFARFVVVVVVAVFVVVIVVNAVVIDAVADLVVIDAAVPLVVVNVVHLAGIDVAVAVMLLLLLLLLLSGYPWCR